ncbi:MAG: protein phosphatase 2C domain-containing protein [Candidatus Competibacteraceae bacterium]|nr:protein phosphatase 2C domain-containing protein [Candidatus Competibacteraceae bacterium]MBK7982374.1 protein phosphatase 2C domain-containing protein [Candidatus Competibacteraceae bacterium]MBK8899074.1 protein phosphatase 2C domain-containing protein [Candidatus Competibacteraceae bacterium]MBK8963116.1 protein phosphatase 2C domain-containing protein [Candidatus Competibacteraceae bacterium]MBK9952079.1 protein phosphatase 2C domain-containing protein [Candidatus Competibacteraceae bact
MSEAGDWRYVYASVPGVAHQASAIECQDACSAQLLGGPENAPLLILVAADGAGSAARPRAGAELACRSLLAEFANRLRGVAPTDWSPTLAQPIFESVRAALAQQAADADLPRREFACTLLGAAVAPDRAFFLQIGDGAIVIGTGDRYRPLFWPQTGQYANETRFVTDSDATAHLECTVLAESVAEIALLTDGLQLLALHYPRRQAHEPFFRPLFQHLRAFPEPGCPEPLTAALERFLDSPAVNQRTHDDKTLILATRLPPAVTGESTEAETEIETVRSSPAQAGIIDPAATTATDTAPAIDLPSPCEPANSLDPTRGDSVADFDGPHPSAVTRDPAAPNSEEFSRDRPGAEIL